MVVAVRPVRMVQVAVHEVVDVITVGHGFVAAVRPMDVVGGVRAAGVGRRAVGRVGDRHGEHVLVDVRLVRVMQVPVVQVVRVTVVQDGSMAAVGAVGVRMVGVDLMVAHECNSLGWGRRMPRGHGVSDTLPGVRQGAADDVEHVVVRESVGDVTALAAAHEEVLRAKDTQPLRDGGEAVALGVGQGGHAVGTVGEASQQAEAGIVADGPEQPCRALDGGGIGGQRRGARVIAGMTVRVDVGHWVRHANIMRSLAQSCKCAI